MRLIQKDLEVSGGYEHRFADARLECGTTLSGKLDSHGIAVRELDIEPDRRSQRSHTDDPPRPARPSVPFTSQV